MEFTVPMALEDFVPVILAGGAMFVLARVMVPTENRALGLLGATLITLGGLGKASWKLIMAMTSSQTDIAILSDALFPLLATGFICLASAMLWTASLSASGARRAVVTSAVLSGVVLMGALALHTAVSPKAARIALLASMVIGNSTVLITAARRSWAVGNSLSAWLFLVYLATGFVMSGLGRLPQSVGLQWVEQSVNTAGAVGLSLGAWLYLRRLRARDAVAPAGALAQSSAR